MAKSKSTGQRDVPTITPSLASLLAPYKPYPVLSPITHPTPQSVLPYTTDLRLYSPDRSTRPVPSVKRSSTRLRAYKGNVLKFANPNLIGVCVRRKIRKEVIHALRKTRKGARGIKHRNFWSDIKC